MADVKVFNNKATFLLEAEGGKKMKLTPMGFFDVPEEFTGCPTFKMGVAAGVIQVFKTTKQGDKLEKDANAKSSKGKGGKDPEKDPDKDPEKDPDKGDAA